MVLLESGVLSASTPPSPKTSSSLRHLLDETADLIDSPSFTHILTLLNNEAFSTLIDQKCASQAFKSSPTQQPEQVPQSFSSTATIIPSTHPSAPKTKLATILAVIARQAHSIGDGTNSTNEYLVAMEQGVRELEAFAAVVYSSNFDIQAPGFGPADISPPTVSRPVKAAATSSLPPGPSPAEIITDLNVRPLDEGETEVRGINLRDTEKKEIGETSDDLPAATPADSGFEEVWGKASAGMDTPPQS
jgi:peroxin-3